MSEAKTLAACPCGRVPDFLNPEIEHGSRHGDVSGNCCGRWIVPFTTRHPVGTDRELMIVATIAWNSAPRSQVVKGAE